MMEKVVRSSFDNGSALDRIKRPARLAASRLFFRFG
jgi:hypothetical protein